MTETISIVGMGACTPIGRCAWSSAAAVRAGVACFRQHPYMIDTAGEPMCVALADWIDIETPITDRLASLLFPAIDAALQPFASTLQPCKLAIALGLPAPRPGLPENLCQEMIRRIARHYPHTFSASAAFVAGHASGILGLQAAVVKLAQGSLDACIVAGVDSYITPLTLEWLQACDQLHSAGELNNAWGFIPGEAGAALLVVSESFARARELPLFAFVLGTGTATETARIKTQTVCLGEGLTQAFRTTLAALPRGRKVTDVYCDLNGEPYRADEYGFACVRTREFFESIADFVAPADCWGDAAAAGAVLHVMLAAIAGYKGYAKGPLALVWASSEGGERAATLIATGEDR
jgi:3-oxoacyl-[acyl-carrier-protein] synthase-1